MVFHLDIPADVVTLSASHLRAATTYDFYRDKFTRNKMALTAQLGTRAVHNGEIFTTAEAQGALGVDWPIVHGQYYTIMLIDLDAPAPPPNDTESPYLHWLVTNIPGNQLEAGYTAMSYTPPNPPPSSPAHKYELLLFRQPMHELRYRESEKIQPHPHTRRSRFRLYHFVQEHNLQQVAALSFFVSKSGVGPTPGTAAGPAGAMPMLKPNTALRGAARLSPEEQKYCECVVQVEERNNDRGCGPGDLGSGKCYEPHAVCHSRIHVTGRVPPCEVAYNLRNMSDQQLRAAAANVNIPVDLPYNRENLLRKLEAKAVAEQEELESKGYIR